MFLVSNWYRKGATGEESSCSCDILYVTLRNGHHVEVLEPADMYSNMEAEVLERSALVYGNVVRVFPSPV
jgi:hypothetical protein